MYAVSLNPVVETRAGAVRGRVMDGVNIFKGIPYAAAPFGANRLRPPQPVVPWSGVRDALEYGPTPPKPVIPPEISALLPEHAIPGEECLNLNIWTPELGPARHPVMVWIPGGMFEYGTAATDWYDGSHFARDGIVCVTINYRVGVEGFLCLDERNANRGLLDQIAALRWVQANIAGFGGDPGNVTIFGESAGAMSVGTLLSMPRAEGLFHRAIAQSGAAHHVMSLATAHLVRQRLADKLGFEVTPDTLAAIPLDRLLQAQEEMKADLVSNPDPARWGTEVVTTLLPWEPAIVADTIPAPPLERIAAGANAHVTMMVGSNTDEHRLFLAPGGALDRITDAALAGMVAAFGLPVDTTLAAYRTANPHASAGDLLAAIQTDWYWRIPAIRLADAHALHNRDTYMYEFAWRSPQFNGLLGACHSLEIGFVFDSLGKGTEPLLGPTPPQKLADTMHGDWVAFATTGNPGWPQYDLTRRATMRFDASSAVVDDPRSAELALWAGRR